MPDGRRRTFPSAQWSYDEHCTDQHAQPCMAWKSRHSPCSMAYNIPMLSKFYLCARSAAALNIIIQQVKLHFPFFPSSSIWCCRCCVRSAIQPRQFLEGKAFYTILGNILRTQWTSSNWMKFLSSLGFILIEWIEYWILTSKFKPFLLLV